MGKFILEIKIYLARDIEVFAYFATSYIFIFFFLKSLTSSASFFLFL